MEPNFSQIATFLVGFVFGFGCKELSDILHAYTNRLVKRIEKDT